jgi:hypothetical protein
LTRMLFNKTRDKKDEGEDDKKTDRL